MNYKKILKGWKKTAAYLGVSVRTAQRKVTQDKLPIRKDNRIVIGVVAEIDKWIIMRPFINTSIQK